MTNVLYHFKNSFAGDSSKGRQLEFKLKLLTFKDVFYILKHEKTDCSSSLDACVGPDKELKHTTFFKKNSSDQNDQRVPTGFMDKHQFVLICGSVSG